LIAYVVEADNTAECRLPLRDLILKVRAFKELAKADRLDALGSEDDEEGDGDIEELEETNTVGRASTAAELPVVAGTKRPHSPTTSEVVQVDMATGAVVRVHSNQAVAAAAVGGLETFVSKCLNGVVDEAYGYGWRYPTAKEELQRRQEKELQGQ
jgi:hypothetical protein